MVPPAALCIHLCIGQAYAFSVFNLPMTKLLGITQSTPDDWKLTDLGWIFSIAIFFLGASAAVFGRWVEEGGPRRAMFASGLCWAGGFVLSAALDRHAPAQYRPARRCGVIQTSSVQTRTTLLLVRYRYQMVLPGRHGDVPLIAEDARVLGFEGTPAEARWLDDATAMELLGARPDENTALELGRQNIKQILAGLDVVLPEVSRRGEEFATELREAHRALEALFP